MPFPPFNTQGDLPPGIHTATITQVTEHFQGDTDQRAICTQHLLHIHNLAKHTGHLARFIVFGSYITNKPSPNDIDIILIMDDDFHLEDSPPESKSIFDHATADARHGASIFWIRPRLLIGETVDQFIEHWQIKRDGTKRGIVEITS
jgi:hypothetical protein